MATGGEIELAWYYEDSSSTDDAEVRVVPSPSEVDKRSESPAAETKESPEESPEKALSRLSWCTNPHSRVPWLRGVQNICAVLLLVVNLVTILVYGAFQLTPVMDVLTGEQNARSWLGVTETVQVLAGLLLGDALVCVLWVFTKVTCCWRRNVRSLHMDNSTGRKEARALMATHALTGSLFTKAKHLYSFYVYISGPESPYFLLILFVTEIK